MPKLASILIVLCVASAADAKPKAKGQQSVKAHMERAAKAHQAGKFDVALTELQAAYELDPQPKLIYAIAQVYAKLEQCSEAIDHYEKFIAKTNDKEKQAVAREAIDACKKKLEAFGKRKPAEPEKPEKPESAVFRDRKPADSELPTAEQPTANPEAKPADAKIETKPAPVEQKPVEQKPVQPPPPPPPKVREPPPAAVVTTTQSTHTPWYRDVIGDALVITGVGAGVASYFMYRAAQSDVDAAEAAPTLAEYDDHRHNAERKQLYAFILGGGGIALVASGLLHYALRDDGSRESRGVAIVPTHDGGLITWSGGF